MKVYKAFLASPGDTHAERRIVEEVISELNLMWSDKLALRLDLVRWETHAIPGVGVDSQAVINECIPDDYDLFIGIMWCRYGTPTGRAGSGTVEEFEIAKRRFDTESDSVKLLIYFNDCPLPPSKIDTHQLSKVKSFQESLKSQGVLYSTFNNSEEFKKFLRIHIVALMQEWNIAESSNIEYLNKGSPDKAKQIDNTDLGFLDHIESIEKAMKDLEDSNNRIKNQLSTAMTDFEKQSLEIKSDLSSLITAGDITKVREVNSAAIACMNSFTSVLDYELPKVEENIRIASDAMVNAAELRLQMGPEVSDSTLRQVENWGSTSTGTARPPEPLLEMRNKIAMLPPLSREFNQAKENMLTVMDRMESVETNGFAFLEKAKTAVAEVYMKNHRSTLQKPSDKDSPSTAS